MTTGSITMRAAVSRAVGEPFSVEEVDDDDRRSMIPFRGSQVLIGAQLAHDLIEPLGEEARAARVMAIGATGTPGWVAARRTPILLLFRPHARTVQ